MSWQLDLAHSQIAFSVRHMMIAKVRGQFERFEGDFNLDESNLAHSTVTVRIEAASINTRNEQRDAHLRSADFLNVEQYPTITFQSTGVQLTGPRTAQLSGGLTIRGITRPVVIDVEYLGSAKSPWGTTSHGFSGTTTINRRDWNLTWNVALETGGVLVGDEIQVDLELELMKAPEPVQAQAA